MNKSIIESDPQKMCSSQKIDFVHKHKPMILIHINGQTVKALVDSGAEINILSRNQFERLNKNNELNHMIEPAQFSATSVSGEKLATFGQVTLVVRVGSKNGPMIKAVFIILKSSMDKCILGFPFIADNSFKILSDGIILEEDNFINNYKKYTVISLNEIELGTNEHINEVRILDEIGEEKEDNIGKEFVFISNINKDTKNPWFYTFVSSIQPNKKFKIRSVSHTEKILIKKTSIVGKIIMIEKNHLNEDFYRILTIILKFVRDDNLYNNTLVQQMYVQFRLITQENHILKRLLKEYKLSNVIEKESECRANVMKVALDNANTVETMFELPKHYSSQSQFVDSVEFIEESSEDNCERNKFNELAPSKLNFKNFDNLNTRVDPDGIGWSEKSKSLDYIKDLNCYLMTYREVLLQILRKHHIGLASSKFDLGKYNGKPVKMSVQDESKPVFCKYRPTPPQLKETAQVLLDRLEEQGVIKRGTSNWSSCARWVVKGAPDMSSIQAKKLGVEAGAKDTTDKKIDLRLTLDLRRLNSVMKYDCFPILSIKKIISMIGKARYVSLLDLPSSFYQIPLDESSKKFFGFSANNIHYILQMVPMGSKNSQQALMIVLTTVLQGLEMFTIIYSDNIILLTFEKDVQVHLDLIDRVMERFAKSGLKISVTKSHFLIHESLQLFGHRINLQTRMIRPDQSKIDKLLSLEFPPTRKLLMSLLGGLNFFMEILGPIAPYLSILNTLLRSPDQGYNVEKRHRDAFDSIKEQLTKDSFVILPDLEKTFYIFSDTGPTFSAGIIMQEGETGNLRPVSYYNKTLSKAESLFSQVEKEAIGLVSLFKSYQYLLQLAEIVLFSDCRSLSFIKQGSVSNLKLNRYSIFLNSFNYRVFFISARSPIIKLVDVFSRPNKNAPRNIRFDSDVIKNIVIHPEIFLKHALTKGEMDKVIEDCIQSQPNGLDITQLELKKRGKDDKRQKTVVNLITKNLTKGNQQSNKKSDNLRFQDENDSYEKIKTNDNVNYHYLLNEITNNARKKINRNTHKTDTKMDLNEESLILWNELINEKAVEIITRNQKKLKDNKNCQRESENVLEEKEDKKTRNDSEKFEYNPRRSIEHEIIKRRRGRPKKTDNGNYQEKDGKIINNDEINDTMINGDSEITEFEPEKCNEHDITKRKRGRPKKTDNENYQEKDGKIINNDEINDTMINGDSEITGFEPEKCNEHDIIKRKKGQKKTDNENYQEKDGNIINNDDNNDVMINDKDEDMEKEIRNMINEIIDKIGTEEDQSKSESVKEFPVKKNIIVKFVKDGDHLIMDRDILPNKIKETVKFILGPALKNNRKFINEELLYDDYWKKIYKYVNEGNLEVKKSFYIEDGLLFNIKGKPKLVIPDALACSIIHAIHVSHFYAHLGIDKTYQLLKDHLYIRKLRLKIQLTIRNCVSCSMTKPSNLPTIEQSEIQIGNYPNQILHIDCLTVDATHNFHILLIVDTFSRFVQLIPYDQNLTSDLVIEMLLLNWISKYGVPEVIMSDNASVLTSKTIECFYIMHGIKSLKIYAYNSKGLLAERYNRSCREKLRHLLTSFSIDMRNWKIFVCYICIGINSSPRNLDNLIPSKIFLGRNTSSGLVDLRPSDSDKLIEPLITEFNKIRNSSQKCFNNKNVEGDIVYLKRYNIRGPYARSQPIYRGPFLVLDTNRTGLLIREYDKGLWDNVKKSKPKWVHKNQVKTHKGAVLMSKGTFRDFLQGWRRQYGSWYDPISSDEEDTEHEEEF